LKYFNKITIAALALSMGLFSRNASAINCTIRTNSAGGYSCYATINGKQNVCKYNGTPSEGAVIEGHNCYPTGKTDSSASSLLPSIKK
jgi:hypothetical protein